MATYVISDIHGQYKMFLDLLDKIKLKDTDTLYILGDILDRGPHPIKALMKIMEMPMLYAWQVTMNIWLYSACLFL